MKTLNNINITKNSISSDKTFDNTILCNIINASSLGEITDYKEKQ